MSIKRYVELLKMNLIFHQNTSDFTVKQLRDVLNIIDELYSSINQRRELTEEELNMFKKGETQ